MASTPKPVFFIGNKRSGTSLLVRLMNLHPEVFVTHEADVLWLLYQARDEWPDSFECYPWDGPLGLRQTELVCGPILDRARSKGPADPRSLFFEMQKRRIGRPTPWRANRTRRLQWIGDKKPVQQCDPELVPFMAQHFPDARLIHVVRHPFAVAASMEIAADTWDGGVPDYWNEGSDVILDRWALQEGWALDLAESGEFPVHRLRLEDLAADPHDSMAAIFAFLDLDPEQADATGYAEIDSQPNARYSDARYPVTDAMAPLMELYGYDTNAAVRY